MTYEKTGLIIVLSLLIGFMACGLGAAHAQPTPVIHENPANLASQQPFDVNGKLTLQLEQMFGSLDNVALRINAGDFKASRLSMSDFEQYYGLFKDNLGRMNLTGSDYQRILSQADLTADDLQAMINGSEAFNASMASFEKYWEKGDTVNATAQAVELQKYFGTMDSSSQQLTASASVISRLLQNTSVNINHLDMGIDKINAFMGRVEALNQLPKSLLGDTDLSLEVSQANVSTGDRVLFYARLSSDNTTIDRGLISLYVDGVPVANVTTSADGTCVIYHTIGGGSFAGTFNAVAYYDPQGANYTPAVSNNVELKRRPISPDLTLSVTPETARFGDIVRMSGRLTADGGYPVPDHLVTISFPGRPARFARTSDNGSYFCDMQITSQVRSGNSDVLAAYDAGNSPDDALINATSPPATLQVIREATSLSLDAPALALQGGDSVSFTGTLRDTSGRPVDGEEVSIFADTVRLGYINTSNSGRYNLSIAIPCNMIAGVHQVYAAYSPPDGMSLSGSQSNEYRVSFTAAPPTITIYGLPLIAFQGDMMDFLVNVTLKGKPVDGCSIIANMSDLTLGRGHTDVSGNLYMVNQINGSAGLQTIKVYSAAGGLLEATAVDGGTVLVLPFDMITSLVILVIILAALGLVLARVVRVRRIISRLRPARKTPLPKPTLKVTPIPEMPKEWAAQPKITRFEDEIARINGIIAGTGDYRQVIVEIYLAARRISSSHGFAVPESATHREFYKKIVAQEPRLNVSAGTIVRHYEAAVFGHKQLGEKDIAGSLNSLKELKTLVADRPAGGGT